MRFLVTLLWSIGINGDNAVDAIVAPIFLQYLAANVMAMTAGQPLPYVTAYGFFTTFVNVGGTGATIALALVLWRSKDPGFRKVEPAVAADADLPDQRADLLRPADRAESGLHDPVRPERPAADDGQLPADALERDPPAVRQRAVDDAADHRALSGDRRRLEGGGVGRRLDRPRHGRVSSRSPGWRSGAGSTDGPGRRSYPEESIADVLHPFADVHACWSARAGRRASWRPPRQAAPAGGDLPAEDPHVPHRRGVRAACRRQGAHRARNRPGAKRRCAARRHRCRSTSSPSSRGVPVRRPGSARAAAPSACARDRRTHANTSPGSAGCPTITSLGIGIDGDTAWLETREGLCAHRLSCR